MFEDLLREDNKSEDIKEKFEKLLENKKNEK
jgi:hypothetical protein